MSRKGIQKKRPTNSRHSRRGQRPAPTVFTRRNYILLIIGLSLIAFGYVIMRIDNQVEGFISLYVAPLLILGGYMEIIYAIFYRAKPEADAR